MKYLMNEVKGPPQSARVRNKRMIMTRIKVLSMLLAMLTTRVADADFKVEPIGAPILEFDGDTSDDPRRVELEYTVHYDGRVTDVEVMTHTDAAYSKAARQAVSEWRFKPWSPNGNPEAVRLAIIMARGEVGGLRAKYRKHVLTLKCHELNAKVDESKAKMSDFNPRKLDVYSESLVVLGLLPDPKTNDMTFQEGDGWRTYFSGVYPSVLRGCRKNPSSLYINQLPELMRRRLP